jgi:integration host factor subunit beta
MAGKVGQKLTKAEIMDSVYQKTGMNRKEIRVVVDLFLDEIMDALIEQTVVEVRGFGTFEVRIRKGREKARNPKTGELVSVNSHGIVAFRPGRDLKRDVWDLVNDGNSPGASEVVSFEDPAPLTNPLTGGNNP